VCSNCNDRIQVIENEVCIFLNSNQIFISEYNFNTETLRIFKKSLNDFEKEYELTTESYGLQRINSQVNYQMLTSIYLDQYKNIVVNPETESFEKFLQIQEKNKKQDLTLPALTYNPICSNCSDEIDYNDMVICDDENYCEVCEAALLFTCDQCSKIHNQDDRQETNDEALCEDCYEEKYFCCTNCNDETNYNNGYSFGHNYFCENCYNERYTECSGCNEVCDIDNMHYSESQDGSYCEDCYEQENENCEQFDSKRLNLNDNTFEKITSKHLFGIELEIDNADINYEDIESETKFGSQSDASLDEGSELVSPILQGDKGYDEILKVCNILQNISVGRSAGYHLHVNAREMTYHDIKRIWLVYRLIETNCIYTVLPKSRLEGDYSIPSRIPIENILLIQSMQDLKETWKGSLNAGGTRRHGFNLEALNAHGTIELRYHSGTSNFNKVINWIEFNFDIFNFALSSSIPKILQFSKMIRQTESNKLKKFNKIINVFVKKETLKEYLLNRFLKVNPIHKTEELKLASAETNV